MRLAFDKPTIIIKDSHTSYSFDTSVIEHIEYPRDLRFKSILKFKEKLTAKIKKTYESSKNDPNYTTFLKHFGEFKLSTIETKEVSSEKYILEELKELSASIRKIQSSSFVPPPTPARNYQKPSITLQFKVNLGESLSLNDANSLFGDLLLGEPYVHSIGLGSNSDEDCILTVYCYRANSIEYLKNKVTTLLSSYIDLIPLN
ncbi:hypothetical protein [Pseudoalteromonas shioyasakiensis]|uniref:hypothetical protein n=1 Tax=Pseudoalteromonas shioyasakiensis TaxID=1190813 RepID=UPI0022B082E8|nr:hypothetical protein [Pseudoalteromonas shioyasakiensis]MCZ4253750.1 hypothetical protein [Pseudoalteromonas shioyasakiensis]